MSSYVPVAGRCLSYVKSLECQPQASVKHWTNFTLAGGLKPPALGSVVAIGLRRE